MAQGALDLLGDGFAFSAGTELMLGRLLPLSHTPTPDLHSNYTNIFQALTVWQAHYI